MSELGYVVVSPSGRIEYDTFTPNRRCSTAKFVYEKSFATSPYAERTWKDHYRRGWRVKVAKLEVQP